MNWIGNKSAVRPGHSHTHATHVSEKWEFIQKTGRPRVLAMTNQQLIAPRDSSTCDPAPRYITRHTATAQLGKLPTRAIHRPHSQSVSQSVMCHVNRQTRIILSTLLVFLRPFEGQRQKKPLHRLSPSWIEVTEQLGLWRHHSVISFTNVLEGNNP